MINKALTWVLLIVVLTAAWLGWVEIKTLHRANEKLTIELETANDRLIQQITLMSRIESATIRLEQREQERKAQYGRFETRLKQLAAQDETLRSVLSTVIPGQLLHGLRPFSGIEQNQGTGAPAVTR